MGAVNVFGSPIDKKKWKRYAKVTFNSPNQIPAIGIDSPVSIPVNLKFTPRAYVAVVSSAETGYQDASGYVYDTANRLTDMSDYANDLYFRPNGQPSASTVNGSIHNGANAIRTGIVVDLYLFE